MVSVADGILRVVVTLVWYGVSHHHNLYMPIIPPPTSLQATNHWGKICFRVFLNPADVNGNEGAAQPIIRKDGQGSCVYPPQVDGSDGDGLTYIGQANNADFFGGFGYKYLAEYRYVGDVKGVVVSFFVHIPLFSPCYNIHPITNTPHVHALTHTHPHIHTLPITHPLHHTPLQVAQCLAMPPLCAPHALDHWTHMHPTWHSPGFSQDV